MLGPGSLRCRFGDKDIGYGKRSKIFFVPTFAGLLVRNL